MFASWHSGFGWRGCQRHCKLAHTMYAWRHCTFLKNWPQLAKLADGAETKTRHKRRKDKKKGTKMPVARGASRAVFQRVTNLLQTCSSTYVSHHGWSQSMKRWTLYGHYIVIVFKFMDQKTWNNGQLDTTIWINLRTLHIPHLNTCSHDFGIYLRTYSKSAQTHRVWRACPDICPILTIPKEASLL